MENIASSTIDPREAAHFGTMAADWWDPNGSSAMLHKLNPVRLRYIRDAIDRHWPEQGDGFRPLAGRRALDVGCGAGLLAEPLARLGASLTALDAAEQNIVVARNHAAGQGLAIDYRATPVERLEEGDFDLITCMEVIEHVADPAAFVGALIIGATLPNTTFPIPRRTPPACASLQVTSASSRPSPLTSPIPASA